MADDKNKPSAASSVAGDKGPKVPKLTEAQKALVVEDFLGVHPKYFTYEGLKIKVDAYLMAHHGVAFNGFKQQKGH